MPSASLSLQRLQSVQALLDGSDSTVDFPEVLSGFTSGALAGELTANTAAGDYVHQTATQVPALNAAPAASYYPVDALASSDLMSSYHNTQDHTLTASLFNHVDTPFLNNLVTPSNQLNTAFAQQLLTYTAPDTAFLFYFSSLLTYEDFGLNFSPAVKELMQKTFSYASYRYFSLLHKYESTTAGAGTDARRLLDTSADFSLFLFFDQASRFYASTLLSPFQHQLTSRSTMLTVDESISTFRSD
jgi:hypothetical protein